MKQNADGSWRPPDDVSLAAAIWGSADSFERSARDANLPKAVFSTADPKVATEQGIPRSAVGCQLSLRVRRWVWLDQAEACEIGDRAQLIVKRDCLDVVHSKQDFIRGVNAHVMDSRTENVVARLDG